MATTKPTSAPTGKDYGIRPKMPRKADWTPMDGVSLGTNADVKTSGVKMRGGGAATKGVLCRGPMA